MLESFLDRLTRTPHAGQSVLEGGVESDADTVIVQEIPESAEHPGLRVRVRARVGPWNGVAVWDVTTGAGAAVRRALPGLRGRGSLWDTVTGCR